jgi:osmotically-inducible protein OsmY
MKDNAQLRRDVLDELHFDPRINMAEVQLVANNGTVTLGGVIGSYSELNALERDVRRVSGVVSVVDHLEVRLLPADERTDADLIGAAKDALEASALVPDDHVWATVDNGRVTLFGEVEYQFERDAAYDAVRYLVGIRSINNQIRIAPRVNGGQVRSQIEQALMRNALTDARNIRVEARDGSVTLSGSVQSWAEYDQATAAAWAAPGIREVVNEISVSG